MPLRRLHHLDLAVANVDESVAFYLRSARPARPARDGAASHVPWYRGGRVSRRRRSRTWLPVGRRQIAPLLRCGSGVYERCLELGANVHFPPEEDRDEPGYWALFVFDPDGFRLEVVNWPNQWFSDSP